VPHARVGGTGTASSAPAASALGGPGSAAPAPGSTARPPNLGPGAAAREGQGRALQRHASDQVFHSGVYVDDSAKPSSDCGIWNVASPVPVNSCTSLWRGRKGGGLMSWG
jgi:hypothetical protein